MFSQSLLITGFILLLIHWEPGLVVSKLDCLFMKCWVSLPIQVTFLKLAGIMASKKPVPGTRLLG